MKMTPKSCSCKGCKAGRSSKSGQKQMKKEERAYRHMAKVKLAKGDDNFLTVPYGSYTD
jgi:hypothetical protein